MMKIIKLGIGDVLFSHNCFTTKEDVFPWLFEMGAHSTDCPLAKQE